MLGPSGEFYAVFLFYKLDDGYTKINTGVLRFQYTG